MGYLSAACRQARNLLAVSSFLTAAVALPIPTRAQTPAVLVIGSDIGGRVGTRAAQVMKIRSSGRRVEIKGNICLSSCTMYLGAGNVCVSPDTVFGFHGPSYYGVPLSDAAFEYWSDVIASFYATPLRRWYMQTARYSTSRIRRISGAQLIKMDYHGC